jgi:hypothetical protein
MIATQCVQPRPDKPIGARRAGEWQFTGIGSAPEVSVDSPII